MKFNEPVTETNKNFVVFDLDGTLCNVEHRLHHVRKSIGIS